MDKAVWEAHLRPDLTPASLDLRQWANELTSEARGYWHGASGRLADRLGISAAAWSAMVRIHCAPAESLGDSSIDLVPYVLARAGLMLDVVTWHRASVAQCAEFFELGRRAGCHRAPPAPPATHPP